MFEVTDFGNDVVKLTMMTRNLWILVRILVRNR